MIDSCAKCSFFWSPSWCPPPSPVLLTCPSVVVAQRSEVSNRYSLRVAVGTQWALVAVEQGSEFGAVGGAEFGAGSAPR
jgi:hypothetical protein